MTSLTKITAGAIISLAVGVFVLSAILPGAIGQVFNANQTGWDAPTIALWAVIPIVVVAIFLVAFAPRSGNGE